VGFEAREWRATMATVTLPIIAGCSSCGACCQVVTRPPFYYIGDPSYRRLQRDRLDLAVELEADYREREAVGGPWDGTPCLWYDPATRGCRHYGWRPDICRDFEVGDEECRDARKREGIDP
jgi:Fe-S-cluster containining protein